MRHFFLVVPQSNFKPLRQVEHPTDVKAGAARGIIDDRTVDDRVARSDDDLADPGDLSGRSNPCKSARMIHLEIPERRNSPQRNPGSELREK